MSPSANQEVYRVLDQPNGRRSKIKVICIGAGATGLYLAYRMERRMKDFELTVYEKNADIGGIWLENRYPGCACDVPAHIYTYTFRPNPRWSTYYAGSEEIYRYFKDFEQEFHLDRYIKFSHSVTKAEWKEDEGIYNVDIRNANGEIVQDWCHVLINASGILNTWKWPSIPGMDKFKGDLLHSASWDDNIDLKGKRVALIGTGSSGIQITPKAQKKASNLEVFIRSPTWIAPQLGGILSIEADPLQEDDTRVNRVLVKGASPFDFSKEDIELFERDPELLLQVRKKMEVLLSNSADVFRHGSEVQKGFEVFLRKGMEDKLKARPDILAHLIPDFPPGCRRLTPGAGYLDALQEPNVGCVYSPIEEFTENGLKTADGVVHEADVVICATGFDVSYVPHFEVTGRNGLRMEDAWNTDPQCYLGIAASGFPNYFIVLGPRGPWGNGTIIPAMEINADYFISMMEKMQRERIKDVEIKPQAVDDFVEHCDEWHNGQTKSVWASSCRSWYKRGTVDGKPFLWCGMSPSYYKTMIHIRFEDWDYKYKNRNRFSYLGNGKIEADYAPKSEKCAAMAPYIRLSDTPWTLE